MVVVTDQYSLHSNIYVTYTGISLFYNVAVLRRCSPKDALYLAAGLQVFSSTVLIRRDGGTGELQYGSQLQVVGSTYTTYTTIAFETKVIHSFTLSDKTQTNIYYTFLLIRINAKQTSKQIYFSPVSLKIISSNWKNNKEMKYYWELNIQQCK